jgi:hypothetical protein
MMRGAMPSAARAIERGQPRKIPESTAFTPASLSTVIVTRAG